MIEVIHIRIKKSDHGTFGRIIIPEFSFFVGELPWRNNVRSISCIPVGDYLVKLRESPKYGITYHITNVPGRLYILQHSGNLCGDVSLGLFTHTNGCQLLGKYLGKLKGQEAVLCSRPIVKKFMRIMCGETYLLKIREEF